MHINTEVDNHQDSKIKLNSVNRHVINCQFAIILKPITRYFLVFSDEADFTYHFPCEMAMTSGCSKLCSRGTSKEDITSSNYNHASAITP